MSEVVETKEIEMDEATVKAIAEQVTVDTEAIIKGVAEQVIAAQKDANEAVINKSVKEGESDVTAETIEKMTPNERTRAHLKALRSKNETAVQKFNQYAVESLVKAGYMNVTTTADGGGFVPDADMLNEVFSLEANYGVAARLCRVVNVNSDSVKAAALTSTVQFTEVTTEVGVKATTKPVFSYPTVELREFAAIVVMTDQLLEDAAFDVRGFVSAELARAAARKEDELLFTDATSGLANIAGTVETVLTGDLATATGDDIIDLLYSVPTAAQAGATLVLARNAVPVLRKLKDGNGQYLWSPSLQAGTPAQIAGTSYEVSEAFTAAVDANDTVYGVYGNFGQYAVLIRKAGLKLTFHDSGTVNVGGTDYNLIQQDLTAMRAVIRRNVFIPVPGAFAVLKSAA